MHTSAKARLTSVTTHDTDPDPDPYLDPWSGSPPKCNPLFTRHCQLYLKILCKSASFCAELLTDRQTNNNDYISSLAEVTKTCLK